MRRAGPRDGSCWAVARCMHGANPARGGDDVVDRSNGYEGIAAAFVRTRSATIGVTRVRDWAKALPRGAAVVDLGCGPGLPITAVLVAEGLRVHGVDAAPSFVEAFRRNLPST